MAKVRYKDRSHFRDSVRSVNVRKIIKYITFAVIACILAVMQTSFAKIGSFPIGLTLLFVSAIGIFFGERDGAIVGLFGGIIIDSLSGAVIYTSPIVYMIVGYFCGLCIKRFLSKNLPSFIVYTLVVGLFKELVNLFYFVMLSDKLNVIEILINDLIPDYLIYIAFSPIVYLVVFALHRIINKETKKKV